MNIPSLRTGFPALFALGGLAAAAHAQVTASPIPTVPGTPLAPQIFKWPGGYMVMNGSEVIVRSTTPGGSSTNVITGSGNGIGNRIVVSGGAGGVTVVQGARNGIGNQLITDPDDLLIDIDALIAGLKPNCAKPLLMIPPVDPNAGPPQAVPPTPVLPQPTPVDPNAAPAAPPSYKGKASPFWTKKAFNDAYDCNLYWCPTTRLWFRYHGEDDTYRPVPTQPAPPVEVK